MYRNSALSNLSSLLNMKYYVDQFEDQITGFTPYVRYSLNQMLSKCSINLHRILFSLFCASAIQDAQVYFKLCATSLWLRALYITLKFVSTAAAAELLHRIL